MSYAWPVLKLLISAGLIVAVSELAKRMPNTLIAGMLASLPLISYLSFIWLYVETRDTQKISALSYDILWLVLPSLTLFIALPLLLKRMSFAPALGVSTLVMFGAYALTVFLLRMADSGKSAA